MTNPEIVREHTPNGGDYSEAWHLDRNGNKAETMEDAVTIRILEKKDNGEIVGGTFGSLV